MTTEHDPQFSDELSKLIARVIDAPDNKVSILVKAAELDPASDLKNTNLAGCDLSQDTLSGFNFTNSDLRNTKWQGTDATGIILTGADLTDADMSGGNFTNADLTGIIYTPNQFARVDNDPMIINGAKMDHGLALILETKGYDISVIEPTSLAKYESWAAEDMTSLETYRAHKKSSTYTPPTP